jgi:hypothetical protein
MAYVMRPVLNSASAVIDGVAYCGSCARTAPYGGIATSGAARPAANDARARARSRKVRSPAVSVTSTVPAMLDRSAETTHSTGRSRVRCGLGGRRVVRGPPLDFVAEVEQLREDRQILSDRCLRMGVELDELRSLNRPAIP